MREETIVGDPRMLKVALDALSEARSWHERRCKLLGLDAAKKVDIVDRRTPEYMYDDELEKAVLATARTIETGICHPPGSNGKNGPPTVN